MSVSRDGDAAGLAEAELELALRGAGRSGLDLEVAARSELGRLQLLELALAADPAEQRDDPSVVGSADAAPEVDRRPAGAADEDRHLVLLVDAGLDPAVVEAQAGLEPARGAVVDQRVLRVR